MHTHTLTDPKGSKGPIESEGFMAFLSHQALAATKLKEKKVKKASKSSKPTRTNSVTSDTGDPKQEVTTPTTDTPPMETEQLQVPTEEILKKKRVSWASDDNLTIVHYFELNESERGLYMLNTCMYMYNVVEYMHVHG